MNCTNCNTCGVSEKRGCGTSSVFNWLYQIEKTSEANKNLLEVQFKSDRKEIYNNSKEIDLSVGDWILVEAENRGYDIGKISMKGELVSLQMQRKKYDIEKTPLKKVNRKATKDEIEIWGTIIDQEKETLQKAKKIINKFKLEMKLSDVEFQGDKKKATFFYTAEKRVDFRELIKEYSKEFGVRIEMKQIGVRQEASKLGGIGSCGRELCCSTWMTEYPSVSTSAARYQQLSINPTKISGQCGRLKCCLNFELNTYTEALKDFPSTKTKLKFKEGELKFYKLDVFKKTMFYFYSKSPSETIEITVGDVNQIIELNKSGKLPANIEKYIFKSVGQEKVLFEDAAGKDSITRFDNKKKKFKNNRRKKTQ